MSGYTPMIRQYLKIKTAYDDCLLFFRLGDFYELFFDDAVVASKALEITLTSRDGGGGERIPMCGVPYHAADTYIAQLIKRGFKIAICEQMEDPKQAKGVVRREVVQVVTPGTVLTDNVLEAKRNNFLIALCKTEAAYGLAAVDVTTGEFFYTEMSEKQSVLDEVAAYDPAEVLLDQQLGDDAIQQFHETFSAFATTFKKDELSKQDAAELLTRQFASLEESLLQNELAVMTTGHLLRYIKETQKRTLKHLRPIKTYRAEEYMVLDVFARRTLELTETVRERKRHGTLLWLLDKTVTAMGGRLLKKWLDKPLLNKQAIERRLAAVETFLSDLIWAKDVQDILKNVYDIERLAGRIACGTAGPRDIAALKKSLDQMPVLKETLMRGKKSDVFFSVIPDLCEDLRDKIAAALVDEPPVSPKEGGIIRGGYHEELDRLLEAKQNGKAWIVHLEKEEREKTGIKSLKVGYNRVFGYYLEVTKANLHLLPKDRYLRKQTLANVERFITEELKEKETLILEAEERAVNLEYELFVALRNELAQHVDRLQQLADWVATLDVWQSFATVSAAGNYIRPTLREDLGLEIKGGRHPVVEQLLDGEFTPNDTVMHPEQVQVMLITGPNMAGKSTYMRQVALIVLMAHIGCFVPADSAQIPLVDRIFTRIGAADDLTGGQSTFMVEMAETRQAITQATERSLIILDEIGRGTSTYDGMAIAHAVIEYIHHVIGAKTLFSTHYHELTHLGDELKRVVNVHARCEERQGELLFLHRIEPGRADRSYGVQVAKLAGLPERVISRARQVLEQLEGYRETAASEQLSFSLTEPDVIDEREKEVLALLRAWDLYNQTPLETVRFIEKLQKMLT